MWILWQASENHPPILLSTASKRGGGRFSYKWWPGARWSWISSEQKSIAAAMVGQIEAPQPQLGLENLPIIHCFLKWPNRTNHGPFCVDMCRGRLPGFLSLRSCSVAIA